MPRGGARPGAGRPKKCKSEAPKSPAGAPIDDSPSKAVLDAEGYLAAVVNGTEPADAVRVSAARALIQYQKPRQRAPVPSPTPKKRASMDKAADENALLDAWAKKAAAIRARMGR